MGERFRHNLLILAVGAVVLLPGTARLPLIDRDEPRFAEATVEMIRGGDWVVPRFNGEYRFDKPPLSYWLMSAGYALFGQSELGARFPAVASTLALALLLAAMGRGWFTARAGLYAALGLLTCLQTLIHGRSATADMPMILAVTVSQWALFELLRGGSQRYPWRWFWTLYLAQAVGFLAKGPIVLLVPALTLLLFRFAFLRRPLRWRRLRLLPGGLLVVVAVGAWGLPALIRTHGAFWDVGIGKHVVERGLGAFNSRRFLPFYYPLSSFLSLFPWAAFAGCAWYVLRRRRSERNAFLAAWFLAPYLIFAFYATQLPHYVMPAFPAFFLILGQAVESRTGPTVRWTRILAAAVLGVGGLLAATALLGATLPAWDAPFDGLRAALLAAGVMASGLTLAGWCVYSGRLRAAAVGWVICAAGIVALGAGMRAASPAVTLAPRLRAMPGDAVFMFHGFTEPSLVFYSGRRWHSGESLEEVEAFARAPGPRCVVLARERIKLADLLRARIFGKEPARRVERGVSPGLLAEWMGQGADVTEVQGWNLARSEWTWLVVGFRR